MFNLRFVAIEGLIFQQEGQETSFATNIRIRNMNTQRFPIKFDLKDLEICVWRRNF